MADWGAFAGGLTKGYLAGEDMRETRKRTALMGEEVEMRKQDAARRAEEAAWQKKQREALDAYRAEMAAYTDTLPYVRDENGNVDPMNPQNAKANTMAYAFSYNAQRRRGLTTPKQDSDYLMWQSEMNDKEKLKAAQDFMATGDTTQLEKYDPAFKGAKIGVGKGPAGEAIEVLVFPDGRTHDMTMLYAMLPGGKTVLDARERAADNKRQALRDQETIRHNKAVEARMAAAQSTKQADHEDTVKQILGNKNFPESFASAVDNKGIPDKAAPYLALDVTLQLVGDKEKPTKKELREATNKAYKIVIDATQDVADNIKKNPQYKTMSEFDKQKLLEQQRQVIVETRLKKLLGGETPPAAAPVAAVAPAAEKTAAIPVTSGNRRYTRAGAIPVEPGSSW